MWFPNVSSTLYPISVFTAQVVTCRAFIIYLSALPFLHGRLAVELSVNSYWICCVTGAGTHSHPTVCLHLKQLLRNRHSVLLLTPNDGCLFFFHYEGDI